MTTLCAIYIKKECKYYENEQKAKTHLKNIYTNAKINLNQEQENLNKRCRYLNESKNDLNNVFKISGRIQNEN